MQVFLLFFLVNIIVNIECSDTKYIDLLPEKEKEDFLEKIARRIFDEVKTKDDRPKASQELPDEILDQHDGFVKQILKEESDNLRKRANDTVYQKKEEKDGNQESIIYQDRKEDNNNGDRYVDLTLRIDSNRTKRENKRRVFTGYSVEKENGTGKENSEQSDGQDIQVKNFRKRRDYNSETIIKEATKTTSLTEDIAEEHKQTQKPESEVALNSKDNTPDEEATQLKINFDGNEITTQGNLNVDKNVSTERNMNTELQSEISFDGLSKDMAENEHIKLVENDETTKNIHVKTNDKEEKLKVTDKLVNNIEIQNKVDLETSVDETKDSPNYSSRIPKHNESMESVTEPTKIAKAITEIKRVTGENNSKVYNIEITSVTDTSKVIDKDMFSSTYNYDINTKQTSTGKSHDIAEETTRIEGLTTTPSSIQFKNISTDKYKEISNKQSIAKQNKVEIKATKQPKKNIDDSVNGENVADEAVKALRVNFLNANFAKKDHFKDLNAQSGENDIKEYKVYEISSDKLPFLKQEFPKKQETKKTKTEELYGVPNHDYLSKNAFYNSYSFFEPNIDFDNEYKSKDPHIIEKKANPRIQTEKLSNEQSYYIPLYNYSPKNAFYNPYNYFGLNIDETNRDKEVEYENDSFIIEKYDEDGKDGNEDVENEFFSNNDPRLRLEFDDVKRLKTNKAAFKSFLSTPHSTLKDVDFNLDVYLKKKLEAEKHGEEFDEHVVPRAFIEISNYHNKYKEENEKESDESQNIAVDYYFDRNENKNDYFKKKVSLLDILDSEESKRFHNPLRNHQTKRNDDLKQAITIRNNKYQANKTNIKKFKKSIKSIEDLIPHLDIEKILLNLEKMDLEKKQQSRERNKDLDIYVSVLRDMIQENNKALTQYDWLGTTVDIQSAIVKIVDMVESIKNNEDLHPSDLELLKYLIYLHSLAKEDLESKELRSSLLPHAKKRKRVTKDRGLLIKAWLIRMAKNRSIPEEDLTEFEEFLDDIETAFYDLHTSLKYIAMVTPYRNQKWFENLKQIHLDSKRKHILEVILHLSTVRLLGLIEETAKNGLEDDFVAYVIKNKKEIERTKEEFKFVLKLLEDLKNM